MSWRRRTQKLLRHPRPVRLIASRALWHSGLSSLFTTELPDGLKIRFYPSSISAALWTEGTARDEDADFLRLVLRTGDSYVDCGANIGHLALVARQCVGATGAVTAIEANPRIFQYCIGNLELNGFHDVLAINVALGDARGTLQISDRRDDDQNRVGQKGTFVPVRTLDELVGASSITLIKIDVEGYELPVLRGAKQTLERASFVYCELSASNAARFGYEPRDAENLLIDAGFVFAQRRGSHWRLGTAGVFDSLDAEDRPRTGYNLVAVKRNAIAEFEARLAASGHDITTT